MSPCAIFRKPALVTRLTKLITESAMGFLEDIDTSKAPTIPEFFRGKSVFITGGSGFMGQALVEKLLYSCPELDSIYLLMRGKRGVPPGERLEKLYNSSCFDRLRKEKPNVFVQKVHIIPGDILELGLGLSDADRTLLINKVNIVFNVAASVRFDDPLTYAAKMNIRGTRELVELAQNFINLLSFVHVSTCYSNCKNGIIDEVLYPPLADWKEVLDICETMDEHTIRTLTPKYLNGMPNTYVFTKQLAEHLVSEQRGRLPVVILRPSIVVGSIQEPAPGWVNNFNGPVGLTIALGKGIKRSIYGRSDVRCNYVPLDVCIRNFIVTAWARGVTELKPNVDVPIYNICSMDEDMLTMEELIKIGAALDEQNRLDGIVWHVRPPSVTDVFLVHFLRLMVYNVLLSIIIDFILWISGQQPRLLKIQRKIYIADVALFYFVSRNWRMINTKFLNIRNIIKPEDRESFYYVVEKLFEENFLEICINGGKKFLLHDDKKDPVECKAHAFRMMILDRVVIFLVYGTLLWWILNARCIKAIFDHRLS